MKNRLLLLILGLLPFAGFTREVIRINQLGYLPKSAKVAVYLSDEPKDIRTFTVYNTLTGETVFEGKPEVSDGSVWGQKAAYRLDFSGVDQPGGYTLKAGNAASPSFRVGTDVYEGTADFILNYMRQQRCGFNPFLNDSCHVHDGVIVDHPTRSGEQIDVTGGWHDASDYLQYTTTSANAVYQLLFAYRQNPEAYKDFYDARGLEGANGVPDILDEARWGLEWLLKMNPSKNEMYNQIADDRDHRGFRLPNEDTVTYGLGKARPVYFVTGKSQGLAQHKNRTTGVSSTAAKFASSFSLAASIFQSIDPHFAGVIANKAEEAWSFAKSDLGNCQTACVVSPYFYEEDNWVDDMELAAATIAQSNPEDFLREAKYWGELEPVTPWMELHRARHYQFYPFVNLGHYWLAQSGDPAISKQFTGLMKQGLEQLQRWAGNDPFRIGVPFIWCSNNLVVAAATQARLYRKTTGDTTFEKMEAALTDWLFGCNPWGTSMICGLPAGADYPDSPHSSITYLMHETTMGGLVDGPVYKSIYENLYGIQLMKTDQYAEFQQGKAVYHDDMGDYSTNEPTMDGTASLSYLLSALETDGQKMQPGSVKDQEGAIVRLNPKQPTIYLVFSAHEYGEGGPTILSALKKNKVNGSFFFTGEFYSNPVNQNIIKQLIVDGHYLGAHSNQHLLYNDWTKRDSLLVDQQQFISDLQECYGKMAAVGIDPGKTPVFLPPYEWYNKSIAEWSKQAGLTLISFTPGIRTNADYTTPEMANYRSSAQIIEDLKQFEKNDKNGLNGAIILIHFGTSPDRTDKLYTHLNDIINNLRKKGYNFARF